MNQICEIDKIDKLLKKNKEKIDYYYKLIENNVFVIKMSGLNCIIVSFICLTNKVEIDNFLFFVLQMLHVFTVGFLMTSPLLKKVDENNPILFIVFCVPIALAILNMNIGFISWMYFSLIGLIIVFFVAIFHLIATPKEKKEMKKIMEKNLKLKSQEREIIESLLADKLKIKELNDYLTSNKSHMKKRKKILNLFVEKEKDLLTVDSLLEKEYNSILNL